MFRSLIFILSILTLISPAMGQSNPYESTIRGFEQADLLNPPPTNSILVLGSSTIVGWHTMEAAFPRFNVLNRGFGGSQTSDVLYFYDRIVPPYHPPLIIFYEGDNDIAAGKPVSQVFADWTNFVGRVKRDLPDTDILFVSVKPSPSRISLLEKQREFNELVRSHTASDPRLLYADVFQAMLNEAGQPRPELYLSDRLHLTPAGYEVWESVIVPIVEEWAARYPVNVMKAERNGLLIDFGASDSLSGQPDATIVHWNNVTSIGSSDTGAISDLVETDGTATSVTLEMVSRFNGANESGTASAPDFPASATRDSLFGNTETFNGLQNVTPIFKLTGLESGTTYKVSFYASRTGVSDNRETRYTVTGASTGFVDLNVANNIGTTVSIPNATPDENGELRIALTPGPNNNNGNHFTYLGVLRLEALSPDGQVWLFDFGSGGSQTGTQAPAPGEIWNNLAVSIGETNDGSLDELIATNGVATQTGVQMISRFNNSNENGTLLSTRYPGTATGDSLYGNSELFNGQANVTPSFKLTGLDPFGLYTLTFFASRSGVNDNRETRYSVTGETSAFADLDAANNVDEVAVVQNIMPDGQGEITIELSPGPNNNNANHFTYLGVLQVDWVIPAARAPLLGQPSVPGDGKVHFQFRSQPGASYRLEVSHDLQIWSEVRVIQSESELQPVELEASGRAEFYRAVQL